MMVNKVNEGAIALLLLMVRCVQSAVVDTMPSPTWPTAASTQPALISTIDPLATPQLMPSVPAAPSWFDNLFPNLAMLTARQAHANLYSDPHSMSLPPIPSEALQDHQVAVPNSKTATLANYPTPGSNRYVPVISTKTVSKRDKDEDNNHYMPIRDHDQDHALHHFPMNDKDTFDWDNFLSSPWSQDPLSSNHLDPPKLTATHSTSNDLSSSHISPTNTPLTVPADDPSERQLLEDFFKSDQEFANLNNLIDLNNVF